MSYGRRGSGLPGQSGSDSNQGFPGLPKGEGRAGGTPGKPAGGGMLMLLIMGAVAFFVFRGMLGGPGNNQADKEQRPANQNDEWSTDRRASPIDPRPETRAPRNNDNRVEIPGLDPAPTSKGSVQSDKVKKDGWEMEDVDTKKKGERQLPFSNSKEKTPESDAVKKDGWEMKDADSKKKGSGQFPLSNQKKTPPKSDAVKKDGWEMNDVEKKDKDNR